MNNMWINNFSTVKLITLLPLVMLISCNKEATLPKVASIDLLVVKQTTVYYGSEKRSTHFAFPTPDSISFLNTTLYPRGINQHTYEYDEQKQIASYRITDLERPYDTYVSANEVRTYKYDAQKVNQHSNRFPLTPILLNPAGYIADYTYDQNGHRISWIKTEQGNKLDNIILNDNIIQQTSSSLSSGQTARTVYEYDLTKPNLPDPFKNLNGKPSHNLLVKETSQFTWASGDYKRVTTYTYEYDQLGLPKRRTAYSEFFPTPTAGSTKSREKQVAITDFEFAQ